MEFTPGRTGDADHHGVLMLRLKRAYEQPDASDGYRVLVERLWPRGVKKEALRLDAWLKDIAPSSTLRRWFAHDPTRWAEFVRRYREELRCEAAAIEVAGLAQRARRERVTLIYAAKDQAHNSAIVVRDAIEELPGGGDPNP